MSDFPIRQLNLINLCEGFYEHDSGIRVNHRKLPECTDLHWHDYFEFEFVISGTGTHQFNGCEYELKPGSAFLLTQVDFHKVIPLDNLELCTVMFPDHIIDSDLISKLWSLDHTKRILTLPPDKCEDIMHLFNMLFSELKSKDNHKKRYIYDLIECIFIVFLRFAEKDAHVAYPHFNTPIQHALSYIHSHFRSNPSLSEVSKISRYTPNYFCDIFKKITGKTYNKYLNDLKLGFARQLLLSSDLLVTEICYASGFSSLSHFLRLFKSTFGTSPQNLRDSKEEIKKS